MKDTLLIILVHGFGGPSRLMVGLFWFLRPIEVISPSVRQSTEHQDPGSMDGMPDLDRHASEDRTVGCVGVGTLPTIAWIVEKSVSNQFLARMNLN